MNPNNNIMTLTASNGETPPLNMEEAKMFVDLMEEVNPTSEEQEPQQVREQYRTELWH